MCPLPPPSLSAELKKKPGISKNVSLLAACPQEYVDMSEARLGQVWPILMKPELSELQAGRLRGVTSPAVQHLRNQPDFSRVQPGRTIG